MSQYIKEFGIVDKELTTKIVDYVTNDSSPFEKSQLYNSEIGKKFIDTDKRSSIYKTITNNDLFSLFDSILDKINIMDEVNNYHIVKNNVTYIKYSEGDFFDMHEDYLSFTSNVLEEYTMIICADANCDGGETLFELNPFFTYASKYSVTPLHCLVFRKDIRHAGSLIKKGYKHIISVNLLCTQKKCDQIMVVSFPENDKYYILSIKKLKGFSNNYLSGYIDFNKLENERLIQYKELFIPYDNFNTIYKIFNRCYITLDEYKESKEYIDYYCITIGDIRIDLDITNKKGENDKKIDDTNNAINGFDSSIIISENHENYQYTCNIVKELKLSYMPFKLVFAEGSLAFGGGMSGTPSEHLEMIPIWFSLSENNHLIYYINLVKKGWGIDINNFNVKDLIDYNFNDPDKINKITGNLEERPNVKLFNYDNEPDENNDTTYIRLDEDASYELDEICYFEGQVYMDNLDINIILECIINEDRGGGINYICDQELKSAKYPKIIEKNGLVAIDGNNKLTFDYTDYQQIIDYIHDNHIINEIKAKIPTIKMNLPQVKNHFDTNFCNEDVYGNFNLIIVEGFIKLP